MAKSAADKKTMKIAKLDSDTLSHGDLYVGEWIEWAKIETRTEAADRLGLSIGYLSAIISGNHKKQPTIEALRKIGRGLGIPVWALFLPPPDRGLQEKVIRFLSDLAARKSGEA